MSLESIRKAWLLLTPHVRNGVSSAAIAKFEMNHHVVLSQHVKEYFKQIDGMSAAGSDDWFNRFWPLAEVDTVPRLLSECRGIPDYSEITVTLPNASSYFVFADHSIWLSVFAVRLTLNPHDSSPVIRISGRRWREVAPSFADFLRLYSEGADNVM